MYATSYRTAYVGDAIQYVLDINKFIKDGWIHGMRQGI